MNVRALGTSTILALLALTGTAAAADNTAATYSYLHARYQLDEAIARNATASQSAITEFSDRLGRECHGVLAGEPNIELGPPPKGPTSPRAKGERKRSLVQSETIQEELLLTAEAAAYQPDLQAAEVFAAQVAPLSWSNGRIAPLAQLRASRLEEEIKPPVADVCADMHAWAQSGYHRLSPASREFEAALTARTEVSRPVGSLESLLKPYEGPSERTLVNQIVTLGRRISKALVGTSKAVLQLPRVLGAPEGPFEKRKSEPVLGHGVTRAGSTFTVRPETSGGGLGASCRRPVSIEYEEHSKSSVFWNSGTSVCLGERSQLQPSIECEGGVASITAVVPASVWKVRLLLSDGRTIGSRVIRVPRKYGGPGGIYVQAVRGRSAYPVSLTEFDRTGGVASVHQLHRVRCRREPRFQPPTFVELASGTTNGGTPFSIQASIAHFGRGQSNFSLELDAGTPSGGEDEATNEGKRKAFAWSARTECAPHAFAIVYGILAAPGDSVLARTPEGLVPLTKVAIAAKLHSGGPLVYGAFATLPSELVVRRSDGSTLYTESLAAKDKEAAEFCEGYVEG